MTGYDAYNREERAMCAHLFRLLHEGLDRKEHSPLADFLGRLGITPATFDQVAIYAEAAMIRDAYLHRKHLSSGSRINYVTPFMDEMVKLLAEIEGMPGYVLYSQLPRPLNLLGSIHPRQIYDRMNSKKKLTPPRTFTPDEKHIYRVMKDVFLAKPDLAITVDASLIIIEAGLAIPVSEVRLTLMQKVARIWAELLYPDLGFEEPPYWKVCSLSRYIQGAADSTPDLTWQDVYEIARETYPSTDRTVVALKGVCERIEKLAMKRAARSRTA